MLGARITRLVGVNVLAECGPIRLGTVKVESKPAADVSMSPDGVLPRICANAPADPDSSPTMAMMSVKA